MTVTFPRRRRFQKVYKYFCVIENLWLTSPYGYGKLDNALLSNGGVTA